MSIHLQPYDNFDFFESVVNPMKAENLHVFSIAVALQHNLKCSKNILKIISVIGLSAEYIDCLHKLYFLKVITTFYIFLVTVMRLF